MTDGFDGKRKLVERPISSDFCDELLRLRNQNCHGGRVMSDKNSSQFAACSESDDGLFLAQDVFGKVS